MLANQKAELNLLTASIARRQPLSRWHTSDRFHQELNPVNVLKAIMGWVKGLK
jgi:hypothetical protein